MIHLPTSARRLNPVRGQTKLTLNVTLRSGREQISRKVTVNYPKKLYPFGLKHEITAYIAGLKTMLEVYGILQKSRPKVRLHRARKLKR